MNKKELMEKLNDAQESMTSIVEAARAENRTLTAEESEQFGKLEAEAKQIKSTIEAMDSVAKMEQVHIITPSTLTEEEQDVKNFAQMIRAAVNGEALQNDANITKGANGVIIPKTIASKIIEEIKDISPIFARATRYNVKGTLSIPKITDANNNIAMAYADEFDELQAKDATFTSVDLTGYLAGVLVKVSNSLINNTDINLTNTVIHLMANAAAEFYEKETLIGTPQIVDGTTIVQARKSKGISGATTITTASASAITADELIGLQDAVKSAFQRNACWIMHPSTLTVIRKLKYTGTGEYILAPDLRNGFGNMLLGKPVFTSDAMATISTGNKTVVYGDIEQALAVKLVEQFELQVLREKYATQHATGFVGWTEFDSDIQNEQAIRVLKQA